jgi:hypothetical protein
MMSVTYGLREALQQARRDFERDGYIGHAASSELRKIGVDVQLLEGRWTRGQRERSPE